jgi:hypothetical protein
MLAGAQNDTTLQAPTAAAIQLWIDEIETTLHRLLDGTILTTLVDVPSLARAVSAAFVGIELGPVAGAALRRRLARKHGN